MRNALSAIALVLGLADPAIAGTGWHIRQSGTIGCVLRADAEQIVYLPPTDDVRALARKLVIGGRCIILAGGADVVIVPKGVTETSLRSGGLPTARSCLSIAGRFKTTGMRAHR